MRFPRVCDGGFAGDAADDAGFAVKSGAFEEVAGEFVEGFVAVIRG